MATSWGIRGLREFGGCFCYLRQFLGPCGLTRENGRPARASPVPASPVPVSSRYSPTGARKPRSVLFSSGRRPASPMGCSLHWWIRRPRPSRAGVFSFLRAVHPVPGRRLRSSERWRRPLFVSTGGRATRDILLPAWLVTACGGWSWMSRSSHLSWCLNLNFVCSSIRSMWNSSLVPSESNPIIFIDISS